MTHASGGLVLPRRNQVPKLGDKDLDGLVNLHYLPVTKVLYRARYRLALRMLEGKRYGRFLEVGYGAGMLLPSLAALCDNLYSFDYHLFAPKVRGMLSEMRTDAQLWRGSVFEIAARDASFDGVLCMSVMEHFKELDPIAIELKRVLKPGGTLVLGIPTKSATSSLLFRAVGYNVDDIHPSSHTAIMQCAARHFSLDAAAEFPGVPGLPVLYRACRYTR